VAPKRPCRMFSNCRRLTPTAPRQLDDTCWVAASHDAGPCRPLGELYRLTIQGLPPQERPKWPPKKIQLAGDVQGRRRGRSGQEHPRRRTRQARCQERDLHIVEGFSGNTLKWRHYFRQVFTGRALTSTVVPCPSTGRAQPAPGSAQARPFRVRRW
jgi:hypothetical protein